MTLPPDKGGVNPRDVKVQLAKWLIAMFYDNEAATSAEEHFKTVFQKKAIPDDIPETTLTSGTEFPLLALMVDHELAPSKAEARRLIEGGGVKLAGEKVPNAEFSLQGQAGESVVLQVGKRRFLKIHFS